MKIGFISSLYSPNEPGGAEKAVRAIAEQAVIEGNQAFVISLAPDGLATTAEINGVRVYYVPLANVGFLHGNTPLPKWRKLLWYIFDSYNPIMGARVKRILADEKPDLVEANNLQGFSVSAWRAAKQLGIPVVQVLHDYYLSCINSTMYTGGHNCEKQCTHCKVLCTPRRHFSDIPVAVSSVSRRMLERIRAAGIFEKVKNFLFSSSGIKFGPVDSTAVRLLHKSGDPLVLGFLGRIDPLKGLDVLLAAISSMPAGSVKILIGGNASDQYAADLKDKYTSNDINFLGFVSPQELFPQIHLLMVPSLWEEPLTRVIPEAHANGVMVAISKLGGMPEIVEEGVTGYSFEANNMPALHALFKKLVDLEFPTFQQTEACLKGRNNFTVETVYAHHQKMWNLATAK